jgi:hypothetical protein
MPTAKQDDYIQNFLRSNFDMKKQGGQIFSNRKCGYTRELCISVT